MCLTYTCERSPFTLVKAERWRLSSGGFLPNTSERSLSCFATRRPAEQVVSLRLRQNKSRYDGETEEERGADETGDYVSACDQNTLSDRFYK